MEPDLTQGTESPTSRQMFFEHLHPFPQHTFPNRIHPSTQGRFLHPVVLFLSKPGTHSLQNHTRNLIFHFECGFHPSREVNAHLEPRSQGLRWSPRVSSSKPWSCWAQGGAELNLSLGWTAQSSSCPSRTMDSQHWNNPWSQGCWAGSTKAGCGGGTAGNICTAFLSSWEGSSVSPGHQGDSQHPQSL